MIHRTRHLALGLLAAVGVVHAAYLTTSVSKPAKAATPAEAHPRVSAGSPSIASGGRIATAGTTGATLPPAAMSMRDAILDAVQSGHLEDLKAALDLNELKPELAAEAVSDPIAFWRKVSDDGEGRDVLAALGKLLDLPYSVQPLGKDPENTGLFIWPAFADRPLDQLTAEEDAQLLLLEPSHKAAQMKSSRRYTGWRLVIGADGVWHSFRRYD